MLYAAFFSYIWVSEKVAYQLHYYLITRVLKATKIEGIPPASLHVPRSLPSQHQVFFFEYFLPQ